MIERLIIVGLIIAAGYLTCRTLQWCSVRRAGQLATSDPVLNDLQRNMPAILYFTADFCMACKMQQRPALERLQQQMGEGVQIIQVDAEAQPDVAQRWGVMSLPTTFVLNQSGQPMAVNYGVASTDKLIKQLNQA